MRKNLKHLALLLLISFSLIISCKKDKSAADFRDSLTGSYACITIYGSGNPNGSGADTIKDTVTVAKSGDSSILIGIDTFAFSNSSLGYIGPGLQFTGQVTNFISCVNAASFPNNGSSIYWVNECQTVSTSSSTVTQGNKIH